MAQLPDVFNMGNAEASDSAYPEAWYRMVIVGSKLKRTADKKGMYIMLNFRFDDGDYEGSIVANNYNIINASDTAVRIAKKNLRQICECLDIDYTSWEETEDFHNGELEVYIKPSGNESFPNSLVRYRKIGAGEDNPSDDGEGSPFD